MSELEKLGYVKKTGNDYIEWDNFTEDVWISYIPSDKTIYIRQYSTRKPIVITTKELMALMMDIGLAELVGDEE